MMRRHDEIGRGASHRAPMDRFPAMADQGDAGRSAAGVGRLECEADGSSSDRETRETIAEESKARSLDQVG